jgi:hypothetical protein
VIKPAPANVIFLDTKIKSATIKINKTTLKAIKWKVSFNVENSGKKKKYRRHDQRYHSSIQNRFHKRLFFPDVEKKQHEQNQYKSAGRNKINKFFQNTTPTKSWNIIKFN